MLSMIIWGIIFFGFTLACTILWIINDRKNVPKGYDESCSKVDQELNEQGK